METNPRSCRLLHVVQAFVMGQLLELPAQLEAPPAVAQNYQRAECQSKPSALPVCCIKYTCVQNFGVSPQLCLVFKHTYALHALHVIYMHARTHAHMYCTHIAQVYTQDTHWHTGTHTLTHTHTHTHTHKCSHAHALTHTVTHTHTLSNSDNHCWI